MPVTELVNRRWISRSASGPVTSYLQVEKRSQMPVPVRTASYSASGSAPSCMYQGQPSSIRTSAPRASCQACSGERCSSVIVVLPR